MATALPDPGLYAQFAAASEEIAALYEQREYGTAMRQIMNLADRANKYIDLHKPWAMAKDPARGEAVRAIATQGINLFRVLMIYLAPVLPQMAEAAGKFLGAPLNAWQAAASPLLGSALAPYQPLAQRLDPAVVFKLVASEPAIAPAKASATRTAPAKSAAAAPAVAPAAEAPASIGIADFARVDLRVARVLAAGFVEGSDKLLQLTLDLGAGQRNVFSGIRAHYAPEQLLNRLVIVVANLEPRKMRFGVSAGMVLCASGSEGGVFLLDVDSGAQPGMKVS